MITPFYGVFTEGQVLCQVLRIQALLVFTYLHEAGFIMRNDKRLSEVTDTHHCLPSEFPLLPTVSTARSLLQNS